MEEVNNNLFNNNNINDISGINFTRRVRRRQLLNLNSIYWTFPSNYNIVYNILNNNYNTIIDNSYNTNIDNSYNTNIDTTFTNIDTANIDNSSNYSSNYSNNYRNIILLELENIFNRENDNIFLRNILENSFATDKNKYKKILSDKGKKQLKNIKFNSNLDNINTSCPIFQIDFENNEIITQLPCSHCFIPEAIEKWLKEEKAICPVCRFELDYEEVKIEDNENQDLDREEGEYQDAERGEEGEEYQDVERGEIEGEENQDLEREEIEEGEENEDLEREEYQDVESEDISNNNIGNISIDEFSNSIITNSFLNILNNFYETEEERQIQEAILESMRN